MEINKSATYGSITLINLIYLYTVEITNIFDNYPKCLYYPYCTKLLIFLSPMLLLLSFLRDKVKVPSLNNYEKDFATLLLFKEAVFQRCSEEKGVLKNSQNLQENSCAKVSVLKLQAKKETRAQVSSCEFCEIFKNTFFIEHLWWLLFYLLQPTSLSNLGSLIWEFKCTQWRTSLLSLRPW